MRFFVLICIHFSTFNGIVSIAGKTQPLHPSVELENPALHSTNALKIFQDVERPRIGLIVSTSTMSLGELYDATVREAVKQWEYFLVGLDIPYSIISDTVLTTTDLDSIQLLVLPAAESIPNTQLSILKRYLENGGGMILSRHGVRNAGENRNRVDYVLSELLGSSIRAVTPDTAGWVFQRLSDSHLITQGLPVGFSLNVSIPPGSVRVDYHSEGSIGHVLLSNGGSIKFPEPENLKTLIASKSFGKGQVIWFGFNPQDVSQDMRQQEVYQALVLNAMAYVTRTALARVQLWPYGYKSATAVVQLPSSSYSPFGYRSSSDLLLNALRTSNTPATFFVISQQAKVHPDIIQRMNEQGELGLVSETEKPLAGQPIEIQYDRLKTALNYLRKKEGASIEGIYPPGSFYDANTLHALVDLDINYIVSGTDKLFEPEFVWWQDELDYRDSLLAGDDQLIRFYPSLYSYELDEPLAGEVLINGSEMDQELQWLGHLERGFQYVHNAGGLFLFAYEPNVMGLSSERANVLQAFNLTLHSQPTWVATLSEIAEWWDRRQYLSVHLDKKGRYYAEMVIENSGTDEVEGITLCVWFPDIDIESSKLESSTLEIDWELEQDNVILQIKTLEPGTHTIRVNVGTSSVQVGL